MRPLPKKTYEKTPGNWVEQNSQEVTTYELKLTAEFHEKTNLLEIQDIEKSNELVKTEIVDETTIAGQKLQFHRWLVSYDGSNFILEGLVENTGQVTLEDIMLEIEYHADADNFTVQRAPLLMKALTGGVL